MIIENARVFIDGKFHDVDVRFNESEITEIGRNLYGSEVIDGKGLDLYAGIIDAHCHGGFMCSFGHESRNSSLGSRFDQLQFLAAKLPETGVTTVFPTLAADLSGYDEEVEAV